MRKHFYILVFLIFTISCSSDDNTQINEPQIFDFSDRDYTVSAEFSSNDTSSKSLLIVLHGANSSAAAMITASNFNSIAGDNGFIVVYPDAFQGLWNYGEECGKAYPDRPDDTEFIKYIIEQVSAEYKIDKNRIFVTGFSMGGYFSYYLAKKMPGIFAAIAPVAATMPRYLNKLNNEQKISVLIELGTKDASVNYEGTGPEDCDALSGAESIQHWASINGCSSVPVTTYMPDNGIDYLNIRIDNYGSCSTSFETKLISVEGGGHRWYINDEINISEEIMEFFRDKSLKN